MQGVSIIVFHSLQSRFLITDVSYYKQVVGVTKSKRSLKKPVNATKVFTLICHSPNLNSI